MIRAVPTDTGAPKATLATYEHAYAVAVQRRRETGQPQFVLRTEDPVQPFRVTSNGPGCRQTLLTTVA